MRLSIFTNNIHYSYQQTTHIFNWLKKESNFPEPLQGCHHVPIIYAHKSFLSGILIINIF